MIMIISRYLFIGLIYMTLILAVYALSDGVKFVEETFFDQKGLLVMVLTIIGWPVMLALSIMTLIKFLDSRDGTGS